MAPASLDRPASPLRTGSDNAGSPERHSGGDASARRAASRIPDSCMTDRNLILRPTGISKQGDRYLRSLFTAGALAVIRYAKIHGTKHRPWLTALLARKPTKVAAIALANKIARMAWAMMARGRYKEPVALAA